MTDGEMLPEARGAAGLNIDPTLAADVAQSCVVGGGGFVVVGWVRAAPEEADSEELMELVEAAVETYLAHVEEHGDASGLLPEGEG